MNSNTALPQEDTDFDYGNGVMRHKNGTLATSLITPTDTLLVGQRALQDTNTEQ